MKLFGAIAALSIAGVEIKPGQDGGFEVPDETAAELKKAFGLRDTPEKPEDAAPDVPAEIHEAAIAEAQKTIDALAAQIDDLKAQLAAAGNGKKK